MANLRRPRYLSCFYCGRRSSTRYEGQTRFECLHCDATNYLDENGEITDPPVATTKAEPTPPPPRYAVARSASPTADGSSSEIFCETCLKNQHLFTTSLAQYLPEDPNDPEYEELERKYYKFRRGLEQRYPQVCADCEPKVLGRIQQAGYTAKTDHLRRMIDRSRKDRTSTGTSPLNLLDTVGRHVWTASLYLQILSHICAAHRLLYADLPPQQRPLWGSRLLEWTGLAVGLLPAADHLAHWSFLASMSSIWWNPRFVQTVRGFTKHIVGLSNWYAFQIMISFVKLAFLRLVSLPGSQDARRETQVGAYAFMTFFILLIYTLAERSVRTDTAPLFAPAAKLTPKITRTVQQEEPKRSMSDLLDEILHEPPAATPASPSAAGTAYRHGVDEDPQLFRPKSSFNPATAAITGNPFRTAAQGTGADLQLGSLNLSESASSTSQGIIQYGEEMDWSPTQSRHRAFNSYGSSQRQSQGFGQAPVDARAGHFWYKVPPKPTTPAQRVFNPPTAPVIRTSPATAEQVHFRGGKGRGPLQGVQAAEEKTVEFRGPSFFPETPRNDPRNTLTELFSQSFSLDPDGEGPAGRQASARPATVVVNNTTLRAARLVELAILLACMGVWWHAQAGGSEQHRSQVVLGVLVVCLAISLHLNSDALRGVAADRELRWASAVGLVLGIAELSVVCQFGLLLWAGSEGEGIARGGRPPWLIGILGVHTALGLVV